MNSYNDPQQRRQLIMRHYQNSLFRHETLAPHLKVLKHFSTQCVDHLELGYEWVGTTLKDVAFSGAGCAIFLASTDLMLKQLLGQKREQIERILKNYFALLHDQPFDAKLLNELVIFANVKKHFNRLQCALMIYEVCRKMLNDDEMPKSPMPT